jgi:hypothetical protein
VETLDPVETLQGSGNGAAAQGLAACALSVHAGSRELLRELSVQFAPGEVVAVL